VVRKDLSRHADRLVGNKLGQARMVREDPEEPGRDLGPAPIEVEPLKSLETGQRRQVRQAPAASQAEDLKPLETGQWRKVRHLSTVRQIQALKVLEVGQRK
jgi:hypothetical protein